MIKQVIVIRRDLKMRRGKEIAQGAHASMMFLSEAVRVCLNDWHDPEHGKVVLSEVQKAWIAGRFTKVCLQVPDEAGLLAIAEEAKKAGLDCVLAALRKDGDMRRGRHALGRVRQGWTLLVEG